MLYYGSSLCWHVITCTFELLLHHFMSSKLNRVCACSCPIYHRGHGYILINLSMLNNINGLHFFFLPDLLVFHMVNQLQLVKFLVTRKIRLILTTFNT